MVKIYQPKSIKRPAKQSLTLTVERLDLNGDGVAQYQGKPVFVSQALPGETVQARIVEQKSKYLRAVTTQVNTASDTRIEAACPHYSQCGGCDLQHVDYAQQVTFKQQKVAELFKRQTKLSQLPWQPPLLSTPWHYRRKARIGVQYNKAGELTLGFRKRQSNVLTGVNSCLVLPENISKLLKPLQGVLATVAPSKAIGHCEYIKAQREVLLLRVLKKLDQQSLARLADFGQQHDVQVMLDNGRQVTTLDGEDAPRLTVDVDGCSLEFGYADFLQVNAELNETMVKQAIDWFELDKSDNVLDLFCGFGNFSLPMAKRTHCVVGVEGVDAMVEQAQHNARANKLSNCRFYQADLNDPNVDWPWLDDYRAQRFNKVLLDPARAGAFGAMQRIVAMNPDSIVYVSCDPATMSRDSLVLLEHNYRLEKIAIMDMFAQTRHVETMALFVKVE
ncbi:23S rRNA (uracil(1939)-C(5))-methyltransferase RlmD [Thalassotalea ponticola]|uniref:23S rRNA (uracil(1939)-C(5))-methyltransferase RlmD n=1 Tax=Thalassotalea ponticola TaxID=1523392 RepID=UPI0025B4D123|nr:23S rRNA (uracil(1939)-C(5))-methyltransferase RlmD [Thalassotalea ponticola]MDN3652124.1 23S rRNA (uracil(1939)-C(5))-methyltransferase RlmD [Thalassotalea ponticola]